MRELNPGAQNKCWGGHFRTYGVETTHCFRAGKSCNNLKIVYVIVFVFLPILRNPGTAGSVCVTFRGPFDSVIIQIYSKTRPVNVAASCYRVIVCRPWLSDVLIILSAHFVSGKADDNGKMHVTLCDLIMPWESMSATQKKSLSQRYQMGCDCKVIYTWRRIIIITVALELKHVCLSQ